MFAWCPSLLFSKNEIWPLMMANFILVSEKSASKMQMCSKKPLSGGLHDLLMRSFIRTGFRQPEPLDLAGGDKLSHGAHGLFDGHIRVNPVLIVKVDMVDA